MHIRCFFFMPYEIYIYKSMKNISSFLENQKRGEEEKNCQMWGSLVCCTLSLFCVFPPVCLPVGEARTLCSTGVLATGRDGSPLPWAAARTLLEPSLLCRGAGDAHGWSCRARAPSLWVPGTPRAAGEGAGGCRPFGQDAGVCAESLLASALQLSEKQFWQVSIRAGKNTSRITFN